MRTLCGTILVAAVVATLPTTVSAFAVDEFAGAYWIGEADEKETTWREEDAKRCRGITVAEGRDWIGLWC